MTVASLNRRRLAALAGLLGILLAVPAFAGRWVQEGAVDCTATVSHVVAASESRQDLWLINVGTAHIMVGQGILQTLTTTTGFTLHAAALGPSTTARIELRDFRGGIQCVSSQGTQRIQFREIMR